MPKLRLAKPVGGDELRAVRKGRPDPEPDRARIRQHGISAPVHMPRLHFHQRQRFAVAGHLVVHETDLRRIGDAVMIAR